MNTLPVVLLTGITAGSPFAAALVNRVHWSVRAKQGIAFGVAAVIAVIYLYFTGGLTHWTDIATTVGSVFALQQLVYKQLLHDVASKVELATTGGSTANIINTAVPTSSNGNSVIVINPTQTPTPTITQNINPTNNFTDLGNSITAELRQPSVFPAAAIAAVPATTIPAAANVIDVVSPTPSAPAPEPVLEETPAMG
jgi:hypothetical protein